MKWFLLPLVFLIGCSPVIHKSLPPIPSNEEKASFDYMSKEDIITQMNAPVDEKAEEYVDPEIKKRVDSLIPDDIFLRDFQGKTVQEDKTLKFLETETPTSVDLREWVSPIKSQNNGYCTAYATVGAIEADLCKRHGLCTEDLSEQHLFSLYRQYSTDMAVKAASTGMVADEIYWKQYGIPVNNVNQFGHAQIVSYRYLGYDTDEAVKAIANGNYVVIAMKTPNDMLNGASVIRPNSGFARGGHAVLLVGYEKTDKVLGGMYGTIKNSWGENVGDKGFQYMPLSYMCKLRGGYCYYYEISATKSTKIDTPMPVTEVPSWELYCTKIEWWNPATWGSKKKRCAYRCTANCSLVCNDEPSCTRPY